MKLFVPLAVFCLFSIELSAQVGIGTSTPHASAKLEVSSTTQGFLPPRMTAAQRVGIQNPTEGLFVYQIDVTAGLYYYSGSQWIYIINSANTLPVANGGTGATTLTGILKGNGTSAFTPATAGTDYLAPNGSAANLTNFPTLNQNTTGTAANVSGTVLIANGGTGATTQQEAINALSGTQSSGKYLRSDGTNTTLSSLGAADITGTVAVANGGSGATTLTGILKGNGTNPFTPAVAGTDYQAPLTNPVTGTGTSNYLPKFTGSTTVGNSQIFDNTTSVGIGLNTPNASAKLDVSSTTQGFLPPRMTRAERGSINAPAAGLIIWCSNCGANGELQVYNGASWTNMTGGPASPSLPVVTTTLVSRISDTEATGGGNVTNDGGGTITARGVVWNTSPNPTVSLSTKTTDGTGIGPFTSSISGLTPSTTYFIRAYATNATGTSYGSEQTLNLTVGQSAYGGKVAYIFQPGDWGYVTGETHGIIASVAEWSAGWGCANQEGAYGIDIGTGYQNTIDIISQCNIPGIAAKVCADYTVTVDGIVYSDWHLPSITELQRILSNRQAIGGFNSPYILYWSSSNFSGSGAYVIRTDNVSQSFVTNKANEVGVRAVRFF